MQGGYQGRPSPYGPPPQMPSRIDHVPLLGTLMAVHGGLMLAWSLFCVFGASVGAINRLAGTQDQLETTFMIIAYTVFALGSLPAGLMQLVSGLRLRQFKGRTLALVSQWVGVAVFFLGAVPCFPTALALLIFGHIVLLDRAVAMRFTAPSTHP